MFIIGVVIFFVGFVSSLYWAHETGRMSAYSPLLSSEGFFGLAIFIIVTTIGMGLMLMGLVNDAQNSSYRQGQIDAATGELHFRLETLPDSTRIWVDTRGADK